MYFTEEEVKAQLHLLGYYSIPDDKLRQFTEDLECLIRSEHDQTGAHGNEDRSSSEFKSLYADDSDESLAFNHLPRRQTELMLDHEQLRSSTGGNNNVYTIAHSNDSLSAMQGQLGNMNLGGDLPLIPCRTPSNIGIRLHSQLSNTSSVPSMKRKTLRKVNGFTEVYEELSLSRSTSMSLLTVDCPTASPTSNVFQKTAKRGSSDDFPVSYRNEKSLHWDLQPKLYRPPSLNSLTSSSKAPTSRKASSVIIPPKASSLRFKKTDPVARYHQYKQAWEAHKVPGEKRRDALRWAVRGQMLTVEECEKPRRTAWAPSVQIVPTQRKRTLMQWDL